MKKIQLSLGQFAFLISFVSEITKNSDKTIGIVEKALSLTEIPSENILNVESKAKSYEEAIDNLEAERRGSQEEAAAMRQSIIFAESLADIRFLYKEYIYFYFDEVSFEMMLLIRKITDFL